MTPLAREMGSWPVELEKTWFFSDAYKSGTCCSNNVHEKWRKVSSLLFFFIVSVIIVAWLIGLSFILSLCRDSFRGFLFLLVYWNVRHWFPKLISSRLIQLLEACVGMCLVWFISYLQGLKSAREARFCFFFDDMNFFGLSFDGWSGPFFKV